MLTMLKFLIPIFALVSLASCAVTDPSQLERRDQSQSAFFSSFFNNVNNGNDKASPKTSSSVSVSTSTGSSSTVNTVSTNSINFLAFYQNFMDNRYSYVHNNMEFFQTHYFSNIGTLSNELSSFFTYTDDSYTMFIAVNTVANTASTAATTYESSQKAEITSMLSAIVTQFPWYSSWAEKQQGASSTGFAQKNGASNNIYAPQTSSNGRMGFLTYHIVTVLAIVAFLLFY